MVYIILIITIAYLALIASFIWGFDKVNLFHLIEIRPKTKFSILIPFRNEARNLPALLDTIATLAYPKHLYEIIFIDDDSEDDSAAIIKSVIDTIPEKIGISQTGIKIIKNNRLTKSPKKDAITTAIKEAKFEWIITTDADCLLPKYWLESFDAFIQQIACKCVVAPIKFNGNDSFLTRFQVIDALSLQGTTIGAFGIDKPFLCNGANFGYTKSLFKELNGFKGNENMASGDDVFFLEKVIKNNFNDVKYLKCEKAIVTTFTELSWKSLISQRVRWASKSKAYRNFIGKLTGLIVLLMNTTIVCLLLLSCLGVFNIKTLLYILFIKCNIDFYLIFKTASFFNQRDYLKSFLFSFFIYPFITIYIVFNTSFGSYKWKNRNFKV